MIVNLRGTHGSGKSTIVRRLMAGCADVHPVWKPGRYRPIGYCCRIAAGGSLWVVGSYETATGGCDNIATLDAAHAEVLTAAQAGHHVIYEGTVVGNDSKACPEFAAAGFQVAVLVLTTPLEVCMQRVMERRAARGEMRPIDGRNIRRERCVKLRQRAAAGLIIKDCDSDEALRFCEQAFGITAASLEEQWNWRKQQPTLL